jgi:hypothetical protein
MATDLFFEDGSRVLTSSAFEFVFDGEMRRAVRAQSFLTLVVLDTRRQWGGLEVTADADTVEEVATVVGREVRDTDLIGKNENNTLSLVLLDADFDNSTHVIDRLVTRIGHHAFQTPLWISVTAACYPTHAVDADSLKQQAMSRPVANWHGHASRATSRS